MNLNGIKLPHLKASEDKQTEVINIPIGVSILTSQHMGAFCEPIVNVGDEVLVGQKIADSDKFLSVPIHSSVSGKVVSIDDFLLSNGRVCKKIYIESDKKQTVDPSITPPNVTDKESFIKAIKESGLCGLGGAGFPTHIKLNFNEKDTPIDSLVINGAECEPYITSDYREMIENAEDIIKGIKLTQRYLHIDKAYICIEKNKPKAIKLLSDMVKDYPAIEVVPLKESYPQGAEKVIAFNATKRVIKEGQLPSNQGIIVMNISTVSFINKYLTTGMPLINRRLTVEGDAVKNSKNLSVPIGTSVSDILSYAELDEESVNRILLGGLMMGNPIYDLNTPITKTSNAVLALKAKKKDVQTNCINCGRCIIACPMKLMPTKIEEAYRLLDVEALEKLHVGLCMNCGSCSYVCPAKRDLAETNQLAKGLLMPKN